MDSPQHQDLGLQGLVHDLSNVFETVSEAADLLEDDPRWAAVAATLHRSVERGRRLVGGYMDRQKVQQELDVVLNRAAGFLTDLLALLPSSPSVTVKSDVERGLLLRGEGPEWERVFMNLFLNAAQAMPGGGHIEVTANRDSESVTVTVEDSGPGIPDGILPSIFEPHFSTRRRQSGLGLHIVESIVTSNGGAVCASNRKGASGASFQLKLPLAV